MIPSQVVTLSTKGQLVLPRSFRKAAGLHAGSSLTLSMEADGTITARANRGTLNDFFHCLDGMPTSDPQDLDSSIMETIEELDRATRQR